MDVMEFEVLVPDPLEPPYALFVGEIIGWKEGNESPAAAVMLTSREVSLQDVQEFVGLGLTRFTGLKVDGQPVVVYAKTLYTGVNFGRNWIATWLIDEASSQGVFAGPVVICRGLDVGRPIL